MISDKNINSFTFAKIKMSLWNRSRCRQNMRVIRSLHTKVNINGLHWQLFGQVQAEDKPIRFIMVWVKHMFTLIY